MPRTVNPASIAVGAGIAPQGTVEDNSLRYPQRDTDSLRAHLLDPNNAHMAAAIGIVDAGGFYASTDVEGALQELGGGGAAGRHNGLVLGGTFTSGPGLLTLDTPTLVLIGGVLASFGGATVVLPPSATRYVWVDPTTSTLTASPALPVVSSEPILIAKVVTDAGANITSSQDARFFVSNLDRKLDYTLRSDGSAVNDASEACFVTLDAALFWLENYVSTGQERKAVVLVRGGHTVSSTVVVPAGIPNIEFRGEGAASFSTGVALSPMFDVSGTAGVRFTGLTFICDHAASTAIGTNNAALACSNVTVQNCRFATGGATWATGVRLYQATPNLQQGHRVLGSEFTVSNTAVRIDRAVDCVVRDCSVTGNGTVGSVGVALTRLAAVGDNCLVENVRVPGGFDFPLDTDTFRTTLRKCFTSGGGVRVGGTGAVVDGCFFADITNTTAGLQVLLSAAGAVVTGTTVISTTVWAGGDNPSGITVAADGAVVMGCSVNGFYNAAGNNGAGIRLTPAANNKVTSTDISNCHTGVEVLGSTGANVEGCTLAPRVRGVYSDAASVVLQVVNTSTTLDSTTGLHGVVLEGGGASVLGCQVTTGRAFNSYAVGEVPAGVLCGVNAGSGPFTIEGCTFDNLYDSTGQVGGGVVHTGAVQGLTVANCTFNNGGVNSLSATTLNTVSVTGCVFGATAPNLLHMGVGFSFVGGGGTVLDANVSGCSFNFTTSDTGFAVAVGATTVSRFVVANCTYTAVSAPGGVERFVHIAATNGDGVVIDGNTVNFPSANTLGPLFVQGVDTLVVANNNITTTAASMATVLTTNANTVTYTGNNSVGMNGIALSDSGGSLPSLNMTGNTIDGASVTAAVGVRIISANTPLTLADTSLTNNTISACLDAVVLTNTLNTLTVNSFTFTGNTISACRNGVTTDAGTYNNFLVSGNNFAIRNYAVYQSNTASVGGGVKVDGNTITQAAFVAPAVSLGLVMLSGAGLNRASVSRNYFDHAGAVAAIALLLSGSGPEDVAVDENIVRNEVASATQAIVFAATVSNVFGPQASNISLSRNKVNHFGGGFAAILLDISGSVAFNVFRNFHLDDNHVVVNQDNPTNNGVDFRCTGSVDIRGVSMCRNTVFAYGPSVQFTATDAASVDDVLLCDNTTLAGNAASTGAVVFSCTYVGAVPATVSATNINLCRNLVQHNASNYAVRVTCAAPVTNLSVDDNSLQRVGDAGNPVLGTGNIYMFLDNVTGFPTQDAVAGVSVCRNKVTGTNATGNYGRAAILLTSTAGLATEGKNIMVDDNEVYNHFGDAIRVQLGYDSIQNISVNGNKVHTVEGRGIVIERVTTLKGLSVSHNVIQNALSAGGGGGNGTVEVDILDGNGLVFSDNRLGVASRRGFFVDGSSATGSLDGVTFTGNIVDFTNGTGAAEEGLYIFWPHNLSGVTATGNNIRAADTGIHIAGGLVTSSAFVTSTLHRVSVMGNTVSADNYGVRVSNHTTDSGAGTAHLKGVTVTNNTVRAAPGGAMSYGVLVDTVFGELEDLTVANNAVDMGTASTGDGIAVDSNDGTPTGVSVQDNTVVYGNRGVYILGGANNMFSGISVCRNRVRQLGDVGICIEGMGSLRGVAVDDNIVQNVSVFPPHILGLTGYGILLYSSVVGQDSRNISVSGNSVGATQNTGIWVQLLQGSGTPGVSNLSVCHNKVANWNDSTTYSTTPIPAIGVVLCSNLANPHPLRNLNVSHNICENMVDDYVQGFSFVLDENTRQVVFAHNQVLLNNKTNSGAMDWTFTNTGVIYIPKDFSFTGNQFRDTNSAVPTYTGIEGDNATFYGNIGSAANFWTNFAPYFDNGGVGTVLPAVINNHNIDDGT
jgi:hypothetical protein